MAIDEGKITIVAIPVLRGKQAQTEEILNDDTVLYLSRHFHDRLWIVTAGKHDKVVFTKEKLKGES